MKSWNRWASVCAVLLFAIVVVWRQWDSSDAHSVVAPSSTQSIGEGDARTASDLSDPGGSALDSRGTKLQTSTNTSSSEGLNSAGAPTSDEEIKRTREAVRAGIRRLYGDFGVKAGFSPAEAESLIDVLTDQQMQMFLPEPLAESDLAERQRKWLEGRNAAVRSLLGSRRTADFAIYEKSVGARQEVDDIGRELTRANLPLSDEQRAAMIEAAAKYQVFSSSNPFSGNSLGADIQQMSAQLQLRDQSMSVVARGILTSEQYAQYEGLQSRRREVLEAALRREDERSLSKH